jgi:hypothetical protein
MIRMHCDDRQPTAKRFCLHVWLVPGCLLHRHHSVYATTTPTTTCRTHTPAVARLAAGALHYTAPAAHYTATRLLLPSYSLQA